MKCIITLIISVFTICFFNLSAYAQDSIDKLYYDVALNIWGLSKWQDECISSEKIETFLEESLDPVTARATQKMINEEDVSLEESELECLLDEIRQDPDLICAESLVLFSLAWLTIYKSAFPGSQGNILKDTITSALYFKELSQIDDVLGLLAKIHIAKTLLVGSLVEAAAREFESIESIIDDRYRKDAKDPVLIKMQQEFYWDIGQAYAEQDKHNWAIVYFQPGYINARKFPQVAGDLLSKFSFGLGRSYASLAMHGMVEKVNNAQQVYLTRFPDFHSEEFSQERYYANKAINYYREYLDIVDPVDPSYRAVKDLGILYTCLGDFETAADYYRLAIGLLDGSDTTYYLSRLQHLLALAQEKNGNLDDAKKLFEEIKKAKEDPYFLANEQTIKIEYFRVRTKVVFKIIKDLLSRVSDIVRKEAIVDEVESCEFDAESLKLTTPSALPFVRRPRIPF